MAVPKSAAVEKLKFETALEELEGIVRDMEGSELPLEESLAAYKRGIELLTHCRRLLTVAEEKVRILENDNLSVFDPEAGDTMGARLEQPAPGAR